MSLSGNNGNEFQPAAGCVDTLPARADGHIRHGVVTALPLGDGGLLHAHGPGARSSARPAPDRRLGRGPSVASPIICRSALAIEAHRGVASLANTARYGQAMRLALRSDGCAQPTTSDR